MFSGVAQGALGELLSAPARTDHRVSRAALHGGQLLSAAQPSAVRALSGVPPRRECVLEPGTSAVGDQEDPNTLSRYTDCKVHMDEAQGKAHLRLNHERLG